MMTKLKGKRFLKGGCYTLLFFALSLGHVFAKSIKIAIFDTGFCLSKIISNKKIIIHDTYDSTLSLNKNFCLNKKEASARSHGKKVLNTLVKDLFIEKNIEIFPVIIFDKDRNQNLKYWSQAIQYSKLKDIDIILIATGLRSKSIINKKISIPLFMSAPKVGRGIKLSSNVWPQSNHQNSIMIGSFHYYKNQYFKDKGLLYKNRTDYYFKEMETPLSNFIGSSYSVSKGLNQALGLCSNKLSKNTFSLFKKCLNKKKKKLRFDNIKLNLYTY